MNKEKEKPMLPTVDTPQILSNLNDMLSEMNDIHRGIRKPTDPYLSEKIANKIRWLSREIDPVALNKMIKDGKFEYQETMFNLLDDPNFNVKIYNA